MDTEIIKALGGRRAFGGGRIDLLAEVERGLPTDFDKLTIGFSEAIQLR
jgi:hypothetical protein